MVLGYTRAVAALFTLDQTLESFLPGHVKAFNALRCVARNLVYDNLRTADPAGAAPPSRSTPACSKPAGHDHFAPPCTPGRGHDKGKGERQIQYLRHAFFAARPFRDLDDLNDQFRRWRDEVARQRRHPEQPDRTVTDAWADEQPRLPPLRAHPFETELARAVRPEKHPTSASTATSTPSHTPTSVSPLPSSPATPGSASSTNRSSSPDTDEITTPDTPSRTPVHLEGLLAATRQTNTHTTRDRLRAAVPTPTSSSSGSQNAGKRYDPTPPGCSRSSTTTGRTSSPPPLTTPSNAMHSAPVHHPYPRNSVAATRTHTAPPNHIARPARIAGRRRPAARPGDLRCPRTTRPRQHCPGHRGAELPPPRGRTHTAARSATPRPSVASGS